MPLTDTACKVAKPAENRRKLSDGGGLQLWVEPTGSRLWRLAYRFDGKQKVLAIGKYPTISLAVARRRREDAKALLASGIDPSVQKKLEKAARQADTNTFRTIAEEFVAKSRKEGLAAITLSKMEWLLGFAYSDLGDRPIGDITSADVLAVLRKVEERGHHETARRMRSTIGRVFRYAVATARAEIDPTSALKGALTRPKATPRAAITDPKAFGALLRKIDAYGGQATVVAALKLLPLVFCRPGELRAAEWSEFDFENSVWIIPAAKTKMRRDIRKPLSRQAIQILMELRNLTGNRVLVFPSSSNWSRPISENTLNGALRRLGYDKDEATAHGFRATASTLLNESGQWSADAIERELGHVEANDVRRAYARGEYFEERRMMVQWWADFCSTLKREHASQSAVSTAASSN